MYDKYHIGNSFSVGPTTAKLPKHKGILFNASVAATATVNLNLINSAGNTFAMGLSFAVGPTILPMQVYNVNSMGAGLTGLFIS